MKCPNCENETEETNGIDGLTWKWCPFCDWASEVDDSTFGDDEGLYDPNSMDDCDDDPAYMIYDDSEVTK